MGKRMLMNEALSNWSSLTTSRRISMDRWLSQLLPSDSRGHIPTSLDSPRYIVGYDPKIPEYE
jgi:hypothetical protein